MMKVLEFETGTVSLYNTKSAAISHKNGALASKRWKQ